MNGLFPYQTSYSLKPGQNHSPTDEASRVLSLEFEVFHSGGEQSLDFSQYVLHLQQLLWCTERNPVKLLLNLAFRYPIEKLAKMATNDGTRANGGCVGIEKVKYDVSGMTMVNYIYILKNNIYPVFISKVDD